MYPTLYEKLHFYRLSLDRETLYKVCFSLKLHFYRVAIKGVLVFPFYYFLLFDNFKDCIILKRQINC